MLLAGKIKIKAVLGELAEQKTDSVVIFSDCHLVPMGAISSALMRKAGPSVRKECAGINTLKPGDAVITEGGELGIKALIHIALSQDINTMEKTAREELIIQLLRNIIKLTALKSITSVALPSFNSAHNIINPEIFLKILYNELTDYSENNLSAKLSEVLVVFNDRQEFETFRDLLSDFA